MNGQSSSRKTSFATNALVLDTVCKAVRSKILARLRVAPVPFTIPCSILHNVIFPTHLKILMFLLPQLILRPVVPRVQITLRFLALVLSALFTLMNRLNVLMLYTYVWYPYGLIMALNKLSRMHFLTKAPPIPFAIKHWLKLLAFLGSLKNLL